MEDEQSISDPVPVSNGAIREPHTRSSKRKRTDDGAVQTPQSAAKVTVDASEYPRKRVSIAYSAMSVSLTNPFSSKPSLIRGKHLGRIRKTRCDAAKPACSFCVEIGAQCSYRKPSLGDRVSRKENGNPIAKIMERLDRMETLLLDTNRTVETEETGREVTLDTVVWQFPDSALQRGANLGPSPRSAGSVQEANGYISGSNHVSETLKRSDTHQLNLPSLETWSCYAPFNPIFYEESERYISTELQQGANLYSCRISGDLDISSKTCWRLQRSFAKNVLPWIPLFDQEYCVEKLACASNSGFVFENSSVALVMFVLALGAITNDDDNTKDDPSLFAGMGYFLKGCRIVGEYQFEIGSLSMIQCQILRAMYLTHCLRPLQAWNLISEAMRDTIILCQLKKRLENDVQLREMAKRAYWACYVMDYELRAQLVSPPREPHRIHDSMPLPSSERDEPGIFYFLSEIALRQLFENVNDNIGFRAGYTRYAPVITFELRAQLSQWYSNLPPSLRFPLGRVPILDPQKAFLRAQYYSIIVITCWPFIVRFVAQHPDFRGEEELLISHGRECLESCTLYIDTLESIMHCRNLMVYPNILGLQCQILLLLVTLKVPILHQIQVPDAEAAIHKGMAILKIWEDNPSIKIVVERFEAFMGRLGIAPISEVEDFPTLPESHQADQVSSEGFEQGWSHYGQTSAAI